MIAFPQGALLKNARVGGEDRDREGLLALGRRDRRRGDPARSLPIMDYEEYRKALLAKAVDAFAKEGFSALSMKELAQVLGVSPGSFYHYFDSKQDLFFQMTAQLARDIEQHLTVRLDVSLPVEDRVVEVLTRIDFHQKRASMLRPLARRRHCHFLCDSPLNARPVIL